MPDLLAVTTFANLLALSLTLWLGLYIFLRSPYSQSSRLAALTLWSLTSYFFCNAILLNLPGNLLLSCLRQLVLLGVSTWYHLTILLQPSNQKGVRLPVRQRASVLLAYAGAIVLMLLGVFPSDPPISLSSWLAPAPGGIGPMGFTGRAFNPAYPLFLVYLFSFGLLSIVNLWRLRRSSESPLAQSVAPLLWSSALVLSGGTYSTLGSFLRLDLPTLPVETAYAVAVLVLGYAVARFNALLEGKPLDRDFVYALSVVGSLTIFYVLISAALFQTGQVSFLAVVVILVGAIIANSLFDEVRIFLDRLLYRKQFQELRGNLRRMAAEAGTGRALDEHLGLTLESLMRALDIERGVIARREHQCWVVRATRHSYAVGHAFPLPVLMAAEATLLAPSSQGAVGDLVLVSPLIADDSQIGAMVLGQKRSGKPYSPQEQEIVEDLSLQIANAIRSHERQEEAVRRMNALVADFREREQALHLQFQQLLEKGREDETLDLTLEEEKMVPLVEDGLRRLQDYAYLGGHDLAKLRIVNRRLERRADQGLTFIDAGKAVGEILVQAVSKLKPEGIEPGKLTVPSREWQPFIILYDAYVLGEANRDIMSRLYISQGTFNRTRRRALRAVTRALIEMERATMLKSDVGGPSSAVVLRNSP